MTILDVAEDGAGHPYLVMEFVDGETLAQALARKDRERLPDLARRLDLAVEIARTLDYAHRHGVVHRDIKPANILLTVNGHVKIADFGIALLARTASTASDEVPGTPGFVAPELLHGAVAGACSDVFSLGVVLYWMFTGEMPFNGRSVTEITHQVAHVHPLPARQVNWALPLELEEILNKCLAERSCRAVRQRRGVGRRPVNAARGKVRRRTCFQPSPRASRPTQLSCSVVFCRFLSSAY